MFSDYPLYGFSLHLTHTLEFIFLFPYTSLASHFGKELPSDCWTLPCPWAWWTGNVWEIMCLNWSLPPNRQQKGRGEWLNTLAPSLWPCYFWNMFPTVFQSFLWVWAMASDHNIPLIVCLAFHKSSPHETISILPKMTNTQLSSKNLLLGITSTKAYLMCKALHWEYIPIRQNGSCPQN